MDSTRVLEIFFMNFDHQC
uniref:Uncharacterized protein n=1 Tax=Anguilla anguilla TaxID=7936 RepID=A0A0E9PDA6_ANGAN